MSKKEKQDQWLQLCDDIDDGSFDAGLAEIARAVVSRRDIVARRNARRLIRSLEIGDRVMLTNGIKPRYYDGMIGTVTRIEDEAARVELDRLPVRSGAGRPSTEEPTKKLLVEFIFLRKIEAGTGTTQSSDLSADIGDDEEYDEDEAEDDDDD